MTVKQRLTEYLDKKNISKSDFGRTIGVSSAYVTSIRESISPDKIKSIALNYPDLNMEWLLTGEGEMLNTNTKLPTNINGDGVPYFEDIESSGGIIPAMNENGKEIPTFFINYEHFNDCTAYLQHVGDSMYPKYCAGEIIAVKRIFNFDIVLWGEAYLIVTNENANNLRTVKLLFQHDEQSKIILRASNPNYKGDTVINKVDILSMFIVKGKITRNQL